LSSGLAVSADFDKGLKAYNSGDFKAALAEWSPLAKQGISKAQSNLAVMYANGEGVPQNNITAVKWLTKAAEQGQATAQHNLGFMYQNGSGVPKSYMTAVMWYTLAAEQGYANAQHNLALMYEEGNGVAKSLNDAIKWFTLAAEQGYAEAQHNLALMYDSGMGVTENNGQAIKWYTLAAEQGHVDAQYNLALMYEEGEGVTKSLSNAIKWYTLAAEQGDADSQHNLALMYEEGEGVTKSLSNAIKWYTLAAEQGDADSQHNLALIYEEGEDVTKSPPKTVSNQSDLEDVVGQLDELGSSSLKSRVNDYNADYKMAVIAAEEGDYVFAKAELERLAKEEHIPSKYMLGLMYDFGSGVEEDNEIAAKYYEAAAVGGDPVAMLAYAKKHLLNEVENRSLHQALYWTQMSAQQDYNQAQHFYARMYHYGLGVDKDLIRAYMWYDIADINGVDEAKIRLSMVRQMLSIPDLVEAKSKVLRCLMTAYNDC